VSSIANGVLHPAQHVIGHFAVFSGNLLHSYGQPNNNQVKQKYPEKLTQI